MPTCGNRHNEVRRKKLIWGKAGKPKETKNKKKTKKNKKQTKKTRKPRRPTGPECLRHRVVFFFYFFVFFRPQGKDAESWVFSCPKGRMQRVESCHLFFFLPVNAYVKTENVQRGVQKAHSHSPLFWKKNYMHVCQKKQSSGHQIKNKLLGNETLLFPSFTSFYFAEHHPLIPPVWV